MGYSAAVALGVGTVVPAIAERQRRGSASKSDTMSAMSDLDEEAATEGPVGAASPAVVERDFGMTSDAEDGSVTAEKSEEGGGGASPRQGQGGRRFARSATYMSWIAARRGKRKFTDADDEDAARQPVNRWAPVFAGLCCPFSILLEIPGFTEHWYIRTSDSGGAGEIIETQPNPAILDAGLGLSMACAIVANLALVMRFLEKRPRTSTLVTIGCLTAHDVLNIVIVTVFGVVHRVDDGFTYAQSFWMTVASSVVSTACNVTLITDFVRIDDFKHKGSGLTQKQRSLVIACMALLCYLAFGSLVFSFIDEPNLDFQDALYFTICTVTTVGFGDIVPDTTGAKIFLMPYAIVGIILLTVTIVMARESILESFKDSYRRRREKMLRKAQERRLQRKLTMETSGSNPAQTHHHGAADNILHAPQRAAHWIADQPTNAVTRISKGATSLLVKLKLKRNPEELELARMGTATSQESAFLKFSKELHEDEKREWLNRLFIAFGLFLAFWLMGSLVFSLTEHWSYFNALYFSYVFFVSIGYGDFSPKSPAGRGFFIAWALFGIAVMTILLSVLTEGWQNNYQKAVTDHPGGSTRKRLMQFSRKRTMTAGSATTAGSERGADGAPLASPSLNGHGSSPLLPGSPAAAKPADLHSSSASAPATDHEADQPVRDMAQQLIDAAKGFSMHASFWMNQKKGDPPEMLIRLLEQTSQFEDKEYIDELKRLAENSADGDTQKMLFLISYTRSLEHLLETAQEPLALLKAREDEVTTLRRLTGQMEGVLHHMRLPQPDAALEGVERPRTPTSPLSRSATMSDVPLLGSDHPPRSLTPTGLLRQRAPSLLSKRTPSFQTPPKFAEATTAEPEIYEEGGKNSTEGSDRGESVASTSAAAPGGTVPQSALDVYQAAVEKLHSYPEPDAGSLHGHKPKKARGFGTAAHLVRMLNHHHGPSGSGATTPIPSAAEGSGRSTGIKVPKTSTLTFQEPTKP